MKNLKRVFVLFLTAAFLLNYTNIYANTENSLYKDYIPEEAYSYAAENYRDGLGVILDNVKLYGIRGKIEDFQLCDPYIVYDVEKEVQEPLYYFPIKNNQEKIVLVMAVFLTENGWSDSISGCMADELNDKNYLEEECLIYGDSDEICVENKDNQADTERVDGADIEKFTKKDFRNKKKEFKKKYKVDFNVQLEEDNNKCIYQSSFLISTATNILLNTKNAAVNQKIDGENEDICWAASVATIYNYIKNKNISAKKVCDNVGHKYTGGTDKDILDAFKKHELNYIKVNSTLDYDRIRSKLKEKKPISMATRTANNAYGHLVTLVGLDLGERNQPRITIWNSATEQYECMAYLGDNTAYGLFSDTYYWRHSFCFYYK